MILRQQSWPKAIASTTSGFGDAFAAGFHHYDATFGAGDQDVEFAPRAPLRMSARRHTALPYADAHASQAHARTECRRSRVPPLLR